MKHLAMDLEEALDAAAPDAGGETGRIPSRRDAPKHLLVPPIAKELIRMTVEEWLMIGLLWLACLLAPIWMYPLFALLLAGRFHAFGVILHDATHMPLRGKPLSLRFVEVLCGYPIASTLNAMRYHHLRHHRETGISSDPYHKPGWKNFSWWTINLSLGLALVPFWSIRGYVGAKTSVIPRLRPFYARIFLQDRSGESLKNSVEIRDCARAEWGQILFQGACLGLAFLYPWPFILGYAVPVTVAGILAAHRVIIEHNHHATFDRRLETIMHSTHDNFLGIWGKLGLAPRSIGYYIVHHIHPQVGLHALPLLREWYLQRYPNEYPRPRV